MKPNSGMLGKTDDSRKSKRAPLPTMHPALSDPGQNVAAVGEDEREWCDKTASATLCCLTVC